MKRVAAGAHLPTPWRREFCGDDFVLQFPSVYSTTLRFFANSEHKSYTHFDFYSERDTSRLSLNAQ